MFYFFVLDQKKIQNIIREDEKKIEPIFVRVNEGDHVQKITHFWKRQ